METLQSPMWIEDPDGLLMWDEVNDTYVRKPKKKESRKLRNAVIVAASAVGMVFTATAGYLFYFRQDPVVERGTEKKVPLAQPAKQARKIEETI